MTGLTPESCAFCGKLLEGAAFGPIYTPLGLKPTALFPGTNGGANWGGASFDPQTRTLLLAKGVPPTGTSNLGGSIVTAGGLVFIGATDDSRLRAFDKDTGRQIWTYRLPASAHATPMMFPGKNSKQYVVVAAGGGDKYNDVYSDALIAFALP